MSFLSVLGVGMVFILCMFNASKAQTELEEAPIQNGPEMLKQIQGLLQGIQSLLDPSLNHSNAQDGNAACRCRGLQCTCCQRIKLSKIKLNKECCLSVQYLKRNIGFLTTLALGGRRLFSKEISVRNPRPICAGVPYLTRGASICIQLNDLRAGKHFAHGCGTLLGRLFFFTIARIKLGCMNVRFVDETEPVDAVELPYYDSPNWIDTQQDGSFPPIPPFPVGENVVMIETIEQPQLN